MTVIDIEPGDYHDDEDLLTKWRFQVQGDLIGPPAPNFFPWDDSLGERRRMLLSKEQRSGIYRGPWRLNLTDLFTGKTYRIRGASCGLPRCMCDAVIVKEIV